LCSINGQTGSDSTWTKNRLPGKSDCCQSTRYGFIDERQIANALIERRLSLPQLAKTTKLHDGSTHFVRGFEAGFCGNGNNTGTSPNLIFQSFTGKCKDGVGELLLGSLVNY
jgi:hypothetical protein